MTSKPPERLVVDANPMISALLGGAALRAFWNDAVKEWATTQFTVNEVLSYLPRLARKIHVPKEMLRLELELLPLTIYKRESYRDLISEAKRRIAGRDESDVDLLALALKLDYPIWTNDQDFEQTGTTLYTTAKLLDPFLILDLSIDATRGPQSYVDSEGLGLAKSSLLQDTSTPQLPQVRRPRPQRCDCLSQGRGYSGLRLSG